MVVLTKLSILYWRVMPLVFIVEYGLSGVPISTLLFSIIPFFALYTAKNQNGERVFTVTSASKFGPLYYFPLGLAKQVCRWW